jgi:hypothetical protein
MTDSHTPVELGRHERPAGSPTVAETAGSDLVPLPHRSALRRLGERGMVTAEWAIGVIAAVSLAGLLLLFVWKGEGREMITNIVFKIINLVSAWGPK